MVKCKLLSGSFAIFVQLILILLSILSLLLKRYFEYSKRSLLIFTLDISKQAFSSIVAHLGNIIIAVIMTSIPIYGTQCGWYFVSFIVDSIIGGLIISFLLLKLLTYLANKYDWDSLKESGYYGTPLNYNIYLMQTVSWIIISGIGRIISGFIIYIFYNQLDNIVIFIDSLFDEYQLELLFVMLVCPITLNLLSVLIIDSFLKGLNENRDHEAFLELIDVLTNENEMFHL